MSELRGEKLRLEEVRLAEKEQTGKTGGASLATLSAHLGLSKATISRVLSRAPAARSIPPATQDRVLAAAAALNYRPNLLARSLRRGQSMTVGVLVPELSEGYTTLVLAGLEAALSRAGYMFVLFAHHHHPEALERALDMFAERAVDGIVAIDTLLVHMTSLPTVTVSCPDAHLSVTNIVLNHQRAADLAFTHLVGLGHCNIAIIKGQPFSSDTEPRWQSIQTTALRFGVTLSPERVVQLEEDSATIEPGYRATKRLLAAGTEFTALFAFNDISAIGAVRALHEAGLDVPKNVSVVGFDDVLSAALHHPALTTVRQPLSRMGTLAAERLVTLLQGGDAERGMSSLVVEPELIVRASTSDVRRDP